MRARATSSNQTAVSAGCPMRGDRTVEQAATVEGSRTRSMAASAGAQRRPEVGEGMAGRSQQPVFVHASRRSPTGSTGVCLWTERGTTSSRCSGQAAQTSWASSLPRPCPPSRTSRPSRQQIQGLAVTGLPGWSVRTSRWAPPSRHTACRAPSTRMHRHVSSRARYAPVRTEPASARASGSTRIALIVVGAVVAFVAVLAQRRTGRSHGTSRMSTELPAQRSSPVLPHQAPPVLAGQAT